MDKLNLNKLKNKTLLGIGPVTRRVTEEAVRFSNDNEMPILLIPSRRQVECKEQGGGYVYDTSEFCEVVKKLDTKKTVLLARDHGGPYQGTNPTDDLDAEMEQAKFSYFTDIKNGFDILHLDPSIKGKNFNDVVNKIEKLYLHCEEIAEASKRDIIYEVGTEEHGSVYSSDPEVLENFNRLAEICSQQFPKVKFIVGNTGPFVRETFNALPFSLNNAKAMSDIANKHNLLLKEHNLDYTDYKTLCMHPYLNIHSANVAPEFGTEETRILLQSLINCEMFLEYDEFLEICFKSKKWKKWLLPSSSEKDLRHLAIISGHYLMETQRVKEIIEKLNSKMDYELTVRIHIRSIINKYAKAFGWISKK